MKKSSIGITVGISVGFMLGLLVNIIFIPISIGIGGLYDEIKSRKE